MAPEAPGLIPAHAGKTRRAAWIGPRPTAHPRSRGENIVYLVDPVLDAGSSPLTRGKPHHQGHDRQAPGLIPAHAGKTYRLLIPVSARGAHPRSRGENASASLSPRRVGGSSPLTRGKRAACQDQRSVFGLIPAHAGKTIEIHVSSFQFTAHPRSRGENLMITGISGARAGSSPLTRGKLSSAWEGIKSSRLIPAHAGKTQ